MSELILKSYYNSRINKLTSNEQIRDLFSELPSSSIYAYRKTLVFNATKEYFLSNQMLPNGFFNLMEEELRTNGILKTYKKYQTEFEKMENFFNLDKKYFIDLLRAISDTSNPQKRFNAIDYIKDLIRNYNSKSKGHFFKLYNDKALKKLKSITITKQNKELYYDNYTIEYSFNSFIKDLKKNNIILYNKILDYMQEVSNIVIDDIIDDVFSAINDDCDMNTFLNLFGIYKPINYDPEYIKNCKNTNRLHDNYEKILNRENDIKYKELLVEYINNKICGIEDEEINCRISAGDKKYIEVFYHVLKEVDGKAIIDNDKIVLYSPVEIDEERRNRFKKYEQSLGAINSFLNFCKKQWMLEKKKRINDFKVEVKSDFHTQFFDDSSYDINTESFIHYEKMEELIEGIDQEKLSNLTVKEFASLKQLLNKNDLLFTYLIGNISLNDLLLIINNYSSILFYIKRTNLKIDDIEDLLRIAKTFTYVDDLEIALIGYDNLVKIINYNQFSGIDVTDEVIKNRIHKAVYLEAKSELIDKSSLPYDITVKNDGLILERYLNNDPDVLVSGVETKTCFFISVNENDFFFYSLLNKNGFVIKITDEKGNFVARASCFRRNNILMINGIRLKNNEINPKNKEQKELMNKVVSLIEMMGEKLIYSTTGDKCPIDYILCNKAGILENSEYQNKYEMVDFKLIREPINIYNDDWQEFIKIHEEDSALLQEVPHAPNTSFTTDFGDNYPTILITSRNNMGLLRPSDVSLKDEDAIYERPRIATKVYIPEEINDDILARINRIRALYTFIRNDNSREEIQKSFKLIKTVENISKVVFSQDWICIVYLDGTKEYAYTNYEHCNVQEIQRYASFNVNIKDATGGRKLRIINNNNNNSVK